MKVSVICTVRNEEKSITTLLDSLQNGTRRPDEIVIVDGGSRDNTAGVIESYAKSNPSVKLFIEKGANISRGRNVAIKNATHDLIACVDGGCIADKNWLANLIKPFECDPSMEYVLGFYLPDPKTKFEDVVGALLYPHADRIKAETFTPSARSMAFWKKCWEMVDGFPERLYTAEDSLFFLNLKAKNFKYAFVDDAIIYWRPRSSFKSLYKQYYYYAKGSKEACLQYTFVAYGENIFTYFIPILSRYSINLIKKFHFIHLLYVPIVLTAVLSGKIIGTIAGFRSPIREHVRD